MHQVQIVISYYLYQASLTISSEAGRFDLNICGVNVVSITVNPSQLSLYRLLFPGQGR